MNPSTRHQWTAAVSFAVCLIASDCQGVPFVKNSAAVLAAPRQRPAVIVFGATWCSWCRKMEATTLTHPSVEAFADDFIWIQVDIDEQQELAGQYGVRGVPETLILNENGAIIGNVSGYVPADRLAKFLTATLESPQAEAVPLPMAIQQFLESEDDAELLLQIVTALARPDRQGRPAILESFEEKGPVVSRDLIGLLSHEHLAIRAAAAQALRHATGANLPFNAFAPAADRELQAQAWLEWLKDNQG